MKRTAVLMLALLVAAPAMAELYRWTDAQGQVHYSDQPPPPGIKQIKRIAAPGSSGDSAALANRPPVVLFTGNCGATCDQAAAYLRQRGVPFTLRNAETDDKAAKELKQRTGVLEVPVLFVGESMQRGYAPSVWDKMLDVAGYTQSAKPGDANKAPDANPPADADQPAADDAAKDDETK